MHTESLAVRMASSVSLDDPKLLQARKILSYCGINGDQLLEKLQKCRKGEAIYSIVLRPAVIITMRRNFYDAEISRLQQRGSTRVSIQYSGCARHQIVNYMQLINDAIHGPIELTSLVHKIINTPEFHRLKDIKQLGQYPAVYKFAMHAYVNSRSERVSACAAIL